jgi:hypothetical protein
LKNLKLLLPTLAMLAVMSVGLTAPMAHATTFHNITVTVTANGQTSTSTFRVIDNSNNGVINVPVGSGMLSQIKGAFGTTTFVFPGSYAGTFTAFGSTATVVLSSTDQFTLAFTQAS